MMGEAQPLEPHTHYGAVRGLVACSPSPHVPHEAGCAAFPTRSPRVLRSERDSRPKWLSVASVTDCAPMHHGVALTLSSPRAQVLTFPLHMTGCMIIGACCIIGQSWGREHAELC